LLIKFSVPKYKYLTYKFNYPKEKEKSQLLTDEPFRTTVAENQIASNEVNFLA